MSDNTYIESGELMRIGNQLIQYDRERTSAAYRDIDCAWSDQCKCTPCRNFKPQRGTAFPSSFLYLLNQLGIDAVKEAEIYGCYPMPSGKRQYSGWFFFCGLVLEPGEDEVTKDGISYYVKGPGTMSKPGEAFEPNPLALDFTIEIPWVLLDEDPDELYGPPAKPTMKE